MKVQYSKIPTEGCHPFSLILDQLPGDKIFDLMVDENRKIPLILNRAKSQIVAAASLIEAVIHRGGNIFLVGAGTSGRLGVLEAAELPPTFNTPPLLVQAIIAGGKEAVFQSQEGAEDNEQEAVQGVKKSIKRGDLLLGIAASGVTPFVKRSLLEGRKLKAKTIFLTCNPQSPIHFADIIIPLDVGPEILSGSTRLKAGTITKMVLNMLTTIAMVQLGKVYGNRMVDLQPKSKKLRERGIRIVQELCRVTRARALKTLEESEWHVKTAILMIKKNFSYKEAAYQLDNFKGNLRKSLE